MTILFSDIEGSTAIIERLGDERWVDFLRNHRALVRGIVDAYGGSVIKSQGDGFMVAFESAHSALHCAVELQRTFAERTGPDPGTRLRVRIGAHSGSVVQDMDDFYGRNVVLAARIADSADGGEILVSSALKEYTETDPSFSYVERGTLTLKGLSGEHDVYAVGW